MKKVNEKMTKKQIIDIYNEAMEERKEQGRAVDESPVTLPDSNPMNDNRMLSEDIALLKNTLFGELNNIEKEIIGQNNHLMTVKGQVTEAQNKLQYLLDCEVNLDTLGTILESIEKAKEQEKALKKEMSLRADDWHNTFEREKKKEEEDWDYNFNKACREKYDELNANLAHSRKVLKEEQDSFKKLKVEFEAEKTKVYDQYDKTVLELSKCETEVKSLKGQRNEYRTKLSELQHSSEIKESKLQAEIDRLTQAVATCDVVVSDLKETNKALRLDLEKAYSKVQEIAEQSVKSAQPRIIHDTHTPKQ